MYAAAVGQEDNFLEIDLTDLGLLNVAASGGDVYLAEVNGNIYLDVITAENGDVYLKASGFNFRPSG
jgi:hypothetical protein